MYNMTTTTWIAPGVINHPWFTRPSMKRKLSGFTPPGNANENPSSRNPAPSHPTKRRRHDALEAEFSTLSLHPMSLDHVADCTHAPSDPSAIGTHSVPPVFLSGMEPSVPEVKMKALSWYEPEHDRIIVTDLDSSSDEEAENTDPDKTSILISPAILRQISSRSRDLIQSAPPLRTSSQALVLFRPLPVAGITDIAEKLEDHCDKRIGDEARRSRDKHSVDDIDDAMDVELW